MTQRSPQGSSQQSDDDDDAKHPARYIPRLKNIEKFKGLCYTLISIGLILFLFGISLRLTFASKNEGHDSSATKDLSTDEKFEASMRLTGDLLIGSAVATEVLAFTLIIVVRRQRTRQKQRLRQLRNVELNQNDESQSGGNAFQVLPDNSTRTSGKSMFDVLGRIKANWKRQNRYRDAEVPVAPPVYTERIDPPPYEVTA